MNRTRVLCVLGLAGGWCAPAFLVLLLGAAAVDLVPGASPPAMLKGRRTFVLVLLLAIGLWVLLADSIGLGLALTLLGLSLRLAMVDAEPGDFVIARVALVLGTWLLGWSAWTVGYPTWGAAESIAGAYGSAVGTLGYGAPLRFGPGFLQLDLVVAGIVASVALTSRQGHQFQRLASLLSLWCLAPAVSLVLYESSGVSTPLAWSLARGIGVVLLAVTVNVNLSPE